MLGLSSWASAVSGCAALGAVLLAELSRHHPHRAALMRRAAGALACASVGVLMVLAVTSADW